MKKVIILLSLILVMCSAFAVCVFADAEGTISGQHTSWKYVSDTKTLYVYSSYEGGYNETGKHNNTGGWTAYKNEIEHAVIIGKFNKVSTNAFENHPNLISVWCEAQQLGSYAFYNCPKLIRYNSDVDGWAIIKSTTTNGAFQKTGITNVRITSKTATFSAHSSGNCYTFNDGAKIYAPADSVAYENLTGYGLQVIADTTYNINIFVDGVKKTYAFSEGESLLFPVIDGKCVALFEDIEGTELYTGGYTAKTLYAKTLLDFIGSEVRCSDYHGLRAVYEINEGIIPASSEYEIYEYGAISKKQTGVELTLFRDEPEAQAAVAYSNGSYGELLAPPSDGVVRYATTMTGQQTVEDAETEFLFRGYVLVRNKTTGETFVRYTDEVDQSLANAEYLTYKVATESGKLSQNERQFVNSFISAGAVPTYAYTKDELISVMRDVYNSDNYIPGEYISSHEVESWLTRAYLASGEYPAIVGFDFKEGAFSDEKFAKCVEYAENGGILEFSYHMTCPCGADHTDSTKPTQWCSGTGGENVWAQLITEGTAYNTRLKERLQLAVDTLERFDELGIPVLWRPFHEHNGDWFWWCMNQWNYRGGTVSGETFAKLWRYVYNYMTVTCGLDNLVWVLSPSPGMDNNTLWDDGHYSKTAATLGYPGDAYVDIVGIDWYTTAYSDTAKESYNALDAISGDMIFAITEHGGSGTAGYTGATQNELMKTSMQNGIKICYTLNWSGTDSMLHTGDFDTMMSDPVTLGLVEVKSLFDEYYNKR